MPVTARCRATYEDLLAVPDHLVGEILDGELVTSPRPASPHARTAGRVFRDGKVRPEPFQALEADLARWWPPIEGPG